MNGSLLARPTEIHSDGPLDDIDRCARVVAGPGAGKTYWLVRHVLRVCSESRRLGGGGKIACISYTNVAVSEIRTRLGDSAYAVEADTIHGFLYKYVVRPYARLLVSENGLPLVNHAAIDGHDEHKPSPGIVRTWIRDALGREVKVEGAEAYLKKLRWVRAADGSWSLRTIKPCKIPKYFPSSHLKKYKPLYWARGIIDHDDVLHLAFRILEENRDLTRFLAARFPYVFIDEFQDTSRVQAAVVRWLAEAGSAVVVIGDREQSIYGFQGASVDDFESFTVPNLDNYAINGNRRSTQSIVSFLNGIRRDDLLQKHVRPDAGEPVRVYVGDSKEHLTVARRSCPVEEEFVCLVRTNSAVRSLLHPSASAVREPWDEIEVADWDRSFFLERAFRGASLSARGEHAQAVREVMRGLRLRDGSFRDPLRGAATDLKRRGAAVSILEFFAQGGRRLLAKPLLEIYTELSLHLADQAGLGLTAVRGGKFAVAARACTGRELFENLRAPETLSWARTIHQAKGAEFENVMVCIDDPGLAEAFLSRSGAQEEELRLCYVAVSRARERLFISVPSLSPSTQRHLKAAGVNVVLVPVRQG